MGEELVLKKASPDLHRPRAAVADLRRLPRIQHSPQKCSSVLRFWFVNFTSAYLLLHFVSTTTSDIATEDQSEGR